MTLGIKEWSSRQSLKRKEEAKAGLVRLLRLQVLREGCQTLVLALSQACCQNSLALVDLHEFSEAVSWLSMVEARSAAPLVNVTRNSFETCLQYEVLFEK